MRTSKSPFQKRLKWTKDIGKPEAALALLWRLSRRDEDGEGAEHQAAVGRSAGLDRAAAAGQHWYWEAYAAIDIWPLLRERRHRARHFERSKGECEPRVRSEGSDPPARAQHLRPAHRRREADVHLRVGNALNSEDSGAQA
jgi:hypothetical protein